MGLTSLLRYMLRARVRVKLHFGGLCCGLGLGLWLLPSLALQKALKLSKSFLIYSTLNSFAYNGQFDMTIM